MHSHTAHSGRGHARCVVPFALLLALPSCTTVRPDPAIENAIEHSLALGETVTFRAEGGPVDASTPDASTGTLTFADATRRAVVRSPEIQAAMARVYRAAADADQTRLLHNPVLGVVLRWGPGKPQIEASLAQEFVRALQMPRRSSAADHRMRQAAADAVITALDVANGVQELYAAAQASAALVPVRTARIALADNLVRLATARLDAGEGTRIDLVTLQAQRTELLVERDGAELTEREERVRLARRIGEPSSAAAWKLDPWIKPSTGEQTEAAWVDSALVQRPEIQAIAWRLRALGDDAALVGLTPWEGASAGLSLQRDDKWFAGPSASTPLPVFDTGQAQRARVSAEQIEARHDLTLAKQKIVEEVRIAFQTLHASNANLARITDELIPIQRRRLQLAEASYRAGQTDVTALYLAEQDLRAAESRTINAERQAAIAYARLRRAVGGAGVIARLSDAPAASLPHSPAAPAALSNATQIDVSGVARTTPRH